MKRDGRYLGYGADFALYELKRCRALRLHILEELARSFVSRGDISIGDY